VAKMRIHRSPGSLLFDGFNICLMLFVVVVMLYPLLHVLALSLSSTAQVELGNVSVIPRGLDLGGYKFILDNGQFWTSYKNTLIYVSVGTPITLLLTSLIAYPLAMKEFVLRKPLMIFVTVTLFFSGGLIPTYLVIQNLGLINTMWALVLPGAVTAFNVIVYRTFFQAIPIELRESAFIDGANDVVILTRIYWPLSKPLLATFGLFAVVGIWNDWFAPLIYLNQISMYPLALFLEQIIIEGNMGLWSGTNLATSEISTLLVSPVTVEMAVVVVAMVPVLILYPFAQRYFTKGILIGSIKA
jgi:putative aldouronate transport system permease protein